MVLLRSSEIQWLFGQGQGPPRRRGSWSAGPGASAFKHVQLCIAKKCVIDEARVGASNAKYLWFQTRLARALHTHSKSACSCATSHRRYLLQVGDILPRYDPRVNAAVARRYLPQTISISATDQGVLYRNANEHEPIRAHTCVRTPDRHVSVRHAIVRSSRYVTRTFTSTAPRLSRGVCWAASSSLWPAVGLISSWKPKLRTAIAKTAKICPPPKLKSAY